MHFTCRSFIGRAENGFWSQYWEIEPDNPQLVSQKGHLFGLVSMLSSNPNLKELGHTIIEKINTQYYDLTDSDIPEALTQLLSNLKTDYGSTLDDLSIALAVISGRTLHLASLNNVNGIFSRSHQISHVLKGSVDEILTVTGPLRSEDKILLTTHGFYRDIGWDKLKSFLADSKIQNIEENILSQLYSIDNQTGLAAALIQVHDDDTETSLPDPAPVVIPESLAETPNLPLSDYAPEPPSSPAPFKEVPLNSIYVGNHDLTALSKRKKLNILIAAVLLITLVISAYFGYQKNNKRASEDKYSKLSAQIEKTINDAYAIKNLNIDNAKNLANQANDLLDQAKQLQPNAPELADFDNRIATLLTQTGSTEKFQPEMFYDTSQIFSHPAYQQLLLKDRSLVLLDANSGRIDSLDLSQRNPVNISKNETLKKGILLSLLNDKLYLATNQSVSEVDQNVLTPKIDFSQLPSTVTPLSLRSWNGAFYLLDGQANSIWKFTPNTTSFSEGKVWLKTGEELAPNAISMAINGSIWVLTRDCKITPFNRGAAENYKPKNLASSPACHHLYTSPDLDNLIFVQGDNLIQIFKKTGDMDAKFDFGSLKIIDFALDESANTLYVLCTDQKIYRINVSL